MNKLAMFAQQPANAVNALSRWDRDSVLPFARQVYGGQVIPGGGILGSDWHLAMPQFAADAISTAQEVGSSPWNGGTPADPAERERMVNAAGAVVGPMAAGGFARNALSRGAGGSELGIFGGRLAQTADLGKLRFAETLDGLGAPRDRIWSETGWFRGPDGKWRFEIDDSKALAGHDPGTGVERARLADAIGHDDLATAYPAVADIPTEYAYGKGGAAGGGYNPLDRSIEFTGRNRQDATRAGLHEAQHAVQHMEGFANGGSPYEFMPDSWFVRRKTMKKAQDTYNRLAGEVESRAVEARRALTPDQRRERPPWLDYDVPEGSMIVRDIRQKMDGNR